jgi:protein gp37
MSKIEWTELTWNPTTGCTKISAGCKHCYAETLSRRLHAMRVHGYENVFKVKIHEDRLHIPLERKKPTVFFVDSMSDLFHEKISDRFISKVFDVIKKTPQHTYQILTKRAERLPEYFSNHECPENVWLGVTVENKKEGIPRINYLRKVNASVRFLSMEPLLEDVGKLDLSGIDWIIVGGESGFKARPMKEEWVLKIKKQADAAKIPFFFKQWGTWGVDGVKRNKKANGKILVGKIWQAYPKKLSQSAL